MIVVRNVFQLRFGVAREALALWQEGIGYLQRSPGVKDVRLLTDVTGPFYTLVLESTHESLAGMEQDMRDSSESEEWHAWYSRFTPLVMSGHREVLSVVGSAAPTQKGGAARSSTMAGAGR